MATPNNININIDFSGISDLIETIATRVSNLTSTDVLFIICAIFLPPVAVAIKVGFNIHFFVNMILTILGIVPGQIHALWVVLFM